MHDMEEENRCSAHGFDIGLTLPVQRRSRSSENKNTFIGMKTMQRKCLGLVCFLVIFTALSMYLLQSVDGGIESLLSIETVRQDVASDSDDEAPFFQPFNTSNPFQNSWCPEATCNNSPVCAPCKRRFLFIVSTGRSGSTTLLRMMNMLPNVRLSGENSNELFVASKLVTNLRTKEVNILDGTARQGAWAHNEIPQQAMACPIQQILETLDIAPTEVLQEMHQRGGHPLRVEEEHNILGAKVIRIQTGDWTPLQASIFFKQNFPCSRIIVNYRSDIESLAQSRAKAGWDSSKEKLHEQVDFLLEFARNLGQDMSKLIDMTKWTEDISILNEVIDWLGYEHCHFDSLLHENHDGYGRDEESAPKFDEKCRFEGTSLVRVAA